MGGLGSAKAYTLQPTLTQLTAEYKYSTCSLTTIQNKAYIQNYVLYTIHTLALYASRLEKAYACALCKPLTTTYLVQHLQQ